jgi:hypothetical protein
MFQLQLFFCSIVTNDFEASDYFSTMYTIFHRKKVAFDHWLRPSKISLMANRPHLLTLSVYKHCNGAVAIIRQSDSPTNVLN